MSILAEEVEVVKDYRYLGLYPLKHLFGQQHQSQSLKDTEKTDKEAGSVLGTALEHLELIVNRKMLHKLMNIKNNTDHTLHNIVLNVLSVFSQSLLQLFCNTEAHRKSFLSTVVVIYNQRKL